MAPIASSSRGGGERNEPSAQLQWKKWKERETSPKRTPIWSESNNSKLRSNKSNNINNVERRAILVPVIYYLSRNGQLEHPHFMEIPLSSSQGLFLRDFINRLNLLRGKGMANQYSWSAKRSYKNGYVWHDLEENDLIHPVYGQEYVLKGSEILLLEPSSSTSTYLVAKTSETTSSSSSGKSPLETEKSSELQPEFPASIRGRRNQSWSSVDLLEYKVYKTELSGDFPGKAAADASTQTDEKRRHRRHVVKEEAQEATAEKTREDEQSTELSREEISPPPSESSPETLESLMKADGRLVLSSSVQSVDRSGRHSYQTAAGDHQPPGGKIKASSVLMSLISCGSMSFRDCGATMVKDNGFSLVSHYKTRLPRGVNRTAGKESALDQSCSGNVAGCSFVEIALEDKEYYSGSLIETRRDDFSALKRSSSYNADRSSHLKLAEKDIDGVRAKCIPRKPKITLPPSANKKEIHQRD